MAERRTRMSSAASVKDLAIWAIHAKHPLALPHQESAYSLKILNEFFDDMSTKLIHGGVRYLQKAIMGLDIEQYRMVKEALHERANLLDIAPHLSYPLPIMLPVYKWWQLPYFWVGIKMYDLVAGKKCIKSSYAISKERALELFPMLKKDKLVGAIVYYDGQHNDARMNLSIALTATRLGATIANHTRVVELLREKGEDGKEQLCGAKVKDEITGREITVKAKCIINATGPFTDTIRKLDNQATKEICAPSMGVHITLPDYYSPEQMGLLDPNTSDGRVIFFLPWEGRTIAGTTDTSCSVTHKPAPTEDDIQFILQEVKNYLNPDVEVSSICFFVLTFFKDILSESNPLGIIFNRHHNNTDMHTCLSYGFDSLSVSIKKARSQIQIIAMGNLLEFPKGPHSRMGGQGPRQPGLGTDIRYVRCGSCPKLSSQIPEPPSDTPGSLSLRGRRQNGSLTTNNVLSYLEKCAKNELPYPRLLVNSPPSFSYLEKYNLAKVYYTILLTKMYFTILLAKVYFTDVLTSPRFSSSEKCTKNVLPYPALFVC
nr:glycerol-3-phosphate dehydrogenase, mitochondrial-like [Penaeus vannamei]